MIGLFTMDSNREGGRDRDKADNVISEATSAPEALWLYRMCLHLYTVIVIAFDNLVMLTE